MDRQQGNIAQANPIIVAGHTAQQIFDLTSAELQGIDVLFVQNPSNFSFGSEYVAHLADIQAAVDNGMTLIIHDRYVEMAESILPGGASFDIRRFFGEDSDIDVLNPSSLVVDGPGGVIDNMTLDGGNSSSHGFAIAGTLPGTADLVLSTNDPTHIVTFSYGFGAGHVVYSSIPLDFYLDGSGPAQVSANFRNIYAPNVVAYGAALTGTGVTVTVNNVAPVVDAIGGPEPDPHVQGETLAFSGSFSDVGILDTHEVQWDFGDGTVIPFTSSDTVGILTPTHSYDASGAYQVTLTVRDDDGGVSSVSKDIVVLAPLRAPRVGEARDAAALTDQTLAPVVAQAIGLWAAAGVDDHELSALGQTQFHITDLPRSVLGAASPSGSVWIDRDAAGHGWVVHSDPDGSFGTPGVDLLTTVVHELGHVLGNAHLDSATHSDNVMAATLPLGVRRSPAALQPGGGLAAGSFTRYANYQVDDLFGGNLDTWSDHRTRHVLTLDRPLALSEREASDVSLDLLRGRSTSRWADARTAAFCEDEVDGASQSYDDWTSSLDAILADFGDDGDEPSDRIFGIGS